MPEYEQQDPESAKPISADEFRNLLLRFIIGCKLPFSVAASPFFEAMIHRLRSNLAIPSRDSIRSDLSMLFIKGHEALRGKLSEAPGRISLAVDAWTSVNQLPFLGMLHIGWIAHGV
jgi:hypothetical protein